MLCTAKGLHQNMEFLLVVINEKFAAVLARWRFHFVFAADCKELMFHHCLAELVEFEGNEGLLAAHEGPRKVSFMFFHPVPVL